MKLRIGIECESIESDSWGVARLTRNLLKELAKRPELANEFTFFLYFKSRVPDEPYLKSPLFVTRITKPPLVPASFNLHYHVWMVARGYLDRLDALFFPAYQLPLLWFKKSLVMTTEDIHAEMRNPQLPFRYRLSYGIFANAAARWATKLMAISESSKKELIRLFGITPERIAVNHLGVTVPESGRAHPQNPKPYLLYVGQAFPRRHLKETMFAFEKIAPEFPDLELVAIGADKYRPPVVEQLKNDIARRLGKERIRHLDHVSDDGLAKLYVNARACIYVSDREAFGLPPLEALAHGTVPVVADAPVSREIFGDAAFFVRQPLGAPDIVDTLRRALTDTAKREEILSARRDIVERYTWSAHAGRFLKIMRELCSTN